MELVDLAWLAGLLEGEGYFCAASGGNNTKPLPRIVLSMCDEDIVQRAATLMNSKASPPQMFPSRPNNKPICTTTKTGREAADLMIQLLPFMGARRAAQISAVLGKCCRAV